METRIVLVAMAVLAAAATARPALAEMTDEDVQHAIERGREWLLSQQANDGAFTTDPKWRNCYTAIALMTLGYMGEHPNRDAMVQGLNRLVNFDTDRDFAAKQGYAVPIRIMALAYVHNKLAADRQAAVRQKMREDLTRLRDGQNNQGGWRYLLNKGDFDFSVSQWPLLAMLEAGRVGVEFPTESVQAARRFYFRGQNTDGGWSYQLGRRSYGSMTAAGLASLYIIGDLIEPASGCPCKNGQSQFVNLEIERRMDAALQWLVQNYNSAKNPQWDWQTNFDEVFYWLYCVERVGMAAGYKHFGQRNWYKEGVEFLVPRQRTEGSWEQIDPKLRTPIDNWGGGRLPDTCFALLFLYKGRAPVLFNKLKFDGMWNAHRRDMANLTRFIEWAKEQPFQWQIVDLAAPLEELHDAPILFISTETIPKWGPAEKAKLRAFTDTGGTILFEASCGNPAVRTWFAAFAKEVWPEWPLTPLGPDHAVFTDPYRLQQRPELMGISDGLRTFLIYSMDDVSCPWHMRAFAAKEYLFQWGVNLFTYASDHAPLRAKLAGPEIKKGDRYTEEPRPGPRKILRIARLRHNGNWEVGANYGALAKLGDYLRNKFGVVLQVKETAAPPVTDVGVPPQNLANFDVAYLTGTREFTLGDAEREALGKWVAAGGFLWAEAAGGATEFDEAMKTLAAQMGWDLKPLPDDHPLMTGTMNGAQGYGLAKGVEFRRALRIIRADKPRADLVGIYAGDRMVGLYSPLDVMFSLSPYEAYACRGYKTVDAGAVATNIVFYLTTLGPVTK